MTSGAPIRVLYFIDRLLAGGTEKQLVGLINKLDRSKVDPHLCTLAPSELPLSGVNCTVEELRFTSFGTPGILPVVARVRDVLRKHRIDVVQTFFQDSTVLGLASSIGTKVRARVVAFRDLGFWRSRAKMAQLRLVYPLADVFVANSAAVAKAHQEGGRLPAEKFRVIFNGVEVPGSPPGPRPLERPVVCCVANLDRPVKRVDLFLRVASLVAAARPDARFVVLGDGPLRTSLGELARDLGIAKAVSFEGRLPDVTAMLAGATVGVVCSDSEGFSNAVLEYMAHGVVCVARRVGGNGEVLEHGHNGLLVDGDTPRELAQQVLAVLGDGPRAAAMRQAAYDTVRSRFSWEQHALAHADLYAQLVRRRGDS